MYRDKIRIMAKDTRFQQYLITPKQWGNQEFEPDPAADKEVPPTQLPIRFNGKNHFHWYIGIEEQIRRLRPDIINVEEEHYSLVTYQIYRLAKRYGAKCLFYTWQNIAKRYPPPFSWIENYVFANSLLAVGGNQESIDILRQKGYHGNTLLLPQMGVASDIKPPDDKRKAKVDIGLDPDLIWLVYCGRLVPEKGVLDLIKAYQSLSEHRIRLLIIGDGPEKQEIINRSAERPDKPVVCTGGIPSRAVDQYLRASDILVLPSHTKPNWKEQFGRVLVEAMAVKTVPIGSDSGEIPNVIQDAGLTFREQDPEDLAAKILQLVENPALYQNMQTVGLTKVAHHYTNDVIASTLLNKVWDCYHRSM